MNPANHFDQAAHRAAIAANLRTQDALNLMGSDRFDLCSAIRQACKSGSASDLTGYERERDQEHRGRHPQLTSGARGFHCDYHDLAPLLASRAVTVDNSGFLVDTENASFIELARPRSAILTLGATLMADLTGNVNLPRITASLTTAWLTSETTSVNDSTQTFGQIALAPHQIAVTLKMSRQLVLQTSPYAQALLTADLMAAIAEALDVAALGGGSAVPGQPVGIVNVPGIGAVSGTSLNNSGVIDLQAAVGVRLSAAGGYVAPLATAKILAKRTADATMISTYVWDGGLYTGRIAGNRAIATDDVPPATVIYGSWDQLIIGQWGPLQIEVSPFGSSPSDFRAGLISLRIMTAVDIAVRDPQAFAVATNVT